MDWTEIALRLGVATLVGVAIGLDRELLHKSAGVRTIGLVALGSALATVMFLTSGTDMAAASRVVQGIVAGIGFLGGGVILRHRGHIEGLTTAASVWAAAALGAGAGLGAWVPVGIGGALILILLVLGGWFEHRLKLRAARTPSGTE
jgi:putative Mg2+ transporter-C (MgtC) family protein